MPVIPDPATTSLATAGDLATYVQRDFSAADTATAALLLDLASAEIRAYTGQTISIVVGDTFTVDPPGYWPAIFLPQLPVTAVASVTVAGTLWTLTTDYVWYGDIGVIELIRHPGTVRRSVVVVYSHGYATDSPQYGVAKAATLALAAGALASAGVDATSESIGTYSVAYADGIRSALWSEASAGLRDSLDSLRVLVVA